MSYLDETLQALAGSDVYVSPSVSGVDVKVLKDNLDGTEIAVVILPESASQEISSLPSFISDLARSTQYDTFFVEVGRDYEAGSRVMPAGQASKLANDIEHTTADPQQAAVAFVKQVRAGDTASDDSGVSVPAVAGGVVGAVVVVAVGVAAWRRKRSKDRREELAPSLFATSIRDLERRATLVVDDKVASAIDSVCAGLARLSAKVGGEALQQAQFESRYASRIDTFTRQIDVYGQVRALAQDELDDRQRARIEEIRAQIVRMSELLTQQADSDVRAITSDSFDLAASELPDITTAFPDAVLPVKPKRRRASGT